MDTVFKSFFDLEAVLIKVDGETDGLRYHDHMPRAIMKFQCAVEKTVLGFLNVRTLMSAAGRLQGT